MQTKFELTTKQAEFIRNARHRWNVACGAVRSGKSHLQISYLIPSRILERKDKRGRIMFLGATRENLERNVLQPIRDIYGDEAATDINQKNFAIVFGVKVYCIGADNRRQVAKIRGSEISYCAIDEATDLNEEVFELLKSRLSLPWSCCDITTNPSFPQHWFKKFLDSRADGVDIYLQQYTLYDNPFLPPDYVRSLEHEYTGTVWYKRYILGEWAIADGLVYPMFLQAIEEPFLGAGDGYALSIDYGTQNAFAALLWVREGKTWHAIHEYRYSGRDTGRQKTDADYVKDMEEFVQWLPEVAFAGGGLLTIIDPSATSFIAAIHRSDTPFRVRHADNNVLDGIRDTATCMQSGAVKISNGCTEIRKEFEGYTWDDKSIEDKPIKVNDHLMDALRYFVRTMRLAKPSLKYKSVFGE